MKVGEMEEEKQKANKNEKEWRNSFAPNDGYYPAAKWATDRKNTERPGSKLTNIWRHEI